MYLQGVSATTLDDVLRVSGVSKSSLYGNFADKTALVQEVVAHQARNLLAVEGERLERVASMAGLKRWRDAVVAANAAQKGAYGCVLGSITVDVADHDEVSRQALDIAFLAYRQLFADMLRRLKADGILRPEARPDQLAIGLLGAVQGGYVLSRAAHDADRLGEAIDAALDHIRLYES
jgi:AcrR family transcriptional regulator